jgi:predicted DNA-binding transcriptional regulator YafY
LTGCATWATRWTPRPARRAVTGSGSVGAALPPLLLDDEEAVAVALSLHTATTGSVAGLEETSLRALTKLQQMLPSRIRHRISAFHATTVALAAPGSAAERWIRTC